MTTDSLTKEQVLKLAREEWARLDEEKTLAEQAACGHARSGTIRSGVVICDDCRKTLTLDDVHYSDDPYALSAIERKGIDNVRGEK